MFMNRYPFEEKAPNSKLQAPEKFQISNSEWICRAIIALCLLASAPLTYAFCGFYVAKADTSLFNKASQVVLVRHEDKTVLTMANDYQGSPKEFAIVIPVPTFLEREQIHVGDKALIDHLDAYSAPSLVEYFDPDPCAEREHEAFSRR